MRRGFVGHCMVMALLAAVAGAAPAVIGPDDRPLSNAAVLADADAYWVGHGTSLPVLLQPDADEHLRLPSLAVAKLLILDAATGIAVPSGRLRWGDDEIPESLASVAFTTADGRLDLGCRGGENVELVVDGYRPQTLSLDPQDRRLTVLLEPTGDLRLRIRPAAEGALWLADEASISVVSPFHAAATKHTIGAGGGVRVRDLDASAVYLGMVLVPGRAPVVGRIEKLPQRLEFDPPPGLETTGRVLDEHDRPLPGARVTATGRIPDLGDFRYRQTSATDGEGRFSVTGLLAGEVTVTACAARFACSSATVEIAEKAASEPEVFRLEPGHDLRLVVQDEFGRPAAGANVFDTTAWLTHETDDDGVLVFDGVRSGDQINLKISGAGLQPWSGVIETGQIEVVLRLPAGGAIEWPILTQCEFSSDEVVATWSRLNDRGREIGEGRAEWDARHRLARADGLEPGIHRLMVRLPGAATMVSETVEIAAGDDAFLPAATPQRGMAIMGRVLDASTVQPVAGAQVTCEPGSPHQFRKPHRLERLQRTLTDADGLFLLEGLDAGRCRTVIRAPGHAPWRRDGVEPDDAGFDLGDIELNEGMTIVGRVVDRSDRPQSGVSVEISEDAAYAYFAEATIRSDHDGWFRAETLPVDRWVLSARRGEATARTTVEGRAGETASVELRLGGMRLEGQVLIGDRPATGGHLVLSTEEAVGDGIVVMLQSDADDRRFFGVGRAPITIAVAGDGRFASDGVSAGVYTASYTPPGSASSPVSRELHVPQTEIHRCVIQFSDAGLEGVVVDPDGLPVAGAAVYVLGMDNRPAANGFSDGDGAFSFMGLDPGNIRVAAVHGEFGDAQPVAAELRSGQVAGPVTIELEPSDGAELSLRVASANAVVAGAPVYLVGAATLIGFTDDLGVADFTSIEAGRYRPCAAAYGGAAGCGAEIDFSNGDRVESAINLGRGGFIEVRLGPMERTPALRVFTTDGIDLTSMLMMVSPPIPGPDGIRIGPLKNDEYRITVAMAEGPRQGDIATVEGETVVLDLR